MIASNVLSLMAILRGGPYRHHEGGGWFGGTVDSTDDGSVVAIGDFCYSFYNGVGKAYLYSTGASTSTPFSIGDRSFNYDDGPESTS